MITEADLVFGRIDVLIVGAGEVPYLPLGHHARKLDQLLAAKVRAPFLILQAAAGPDAAHRRARDPDRHDRRHRW